MRNFRTLDQARNDLHIYQEYIHLIESYTPLSLTEHTIYYYALSGNIRHTAEKLNKLGYKIEDKEISGKDVAQIISSKPSIGDHLHKEIKKLYSKKTAHRKRYQQLKS